MIVAVLIMAADVTGCGTPCAWMPAREVAAGGVIIQPLQARLLLLTRGVDPRDAVRGLVQANAARRLV